MAFTGVPAHDFMFTKPNTLTARPLLLPLTYTLHPFMFSLLAKLKSWSNLKSAHQLPDRKSTDVNNVV